MTGIIVLDGVQYHVTLVNDANYSATANDQIIVYTGSLTSTRIVSLPTAASSLGQIIMVCDATGNPTVNNIEVARTGSDTVNASAGAVVAVNIPYGMATVVAATSGVWLCNAAPMQTQINPLGVAVPVSQKYNFTSTETFGPNTATTPSALVNGNLAFGPNDQTISSTLALSDKSPSVQGILPSGGDQIVDLGVVDGNAWFVIYNAAAANNILLKNSATLYEVIPPGKALMVYVNPGSPTYGARYQPWTSTFLSPTVTNKDLTAQAAAIGATTLWSVPTGRPGVYRVSYSAVITTAATTSCILGGANGFQLVFTDNDTAGSVTTLAGPINATNAIGSQVNGVVTANCKDGNPLQFTFGYNSVGVTPMQFAIHIRVEYLQ